MSQPQPQQLTLDQGLIGLLNAVTVAQQRGAFNLQEASVVFQAFTVVEAFQKSRQQPGTTPGPGTSAANVN